MQQKNEIETPNSSQIITPKEIVSVYTAEYASARAEVVARLTAQSQAANHIFVLLGAATAAVVAAGNSNFAPGNTAVRLRIRPVSVS